MLVMCKLIDAFMKLSITDISRESVKSNSYQTFNPNTSDEFGMRKVQQADGSVCVLSHLSGPFCMSSYIDTFAYTTAKE